MSRAKLCGPITNCQASNLKCRRSRMWKPITNHQLLRAEFWEPISTLQTFNPERRDLTANHQLSTLRAEIRFRSLKLLITLRSDISFLGLGARSYWLYKVFFISSFPRSECWGPTTNCHMSHSKGWGLKHYGLILQVLSTTHLRITEHRTIQIPNQWGLLIW